MRAGMRCCAALGAALALVLAAAAAANATTYPVNTTTDSNDAGGCISVSVCSLRDAVNAVNAGSGGDTIVVHSGTYLLTLGELAVSKSVTISGDGASSTIVDGNHAGRVFDLSPATPGTEDITIRGLAITHGAATNSSPSSAGDGGGILTTARSATLDDVALVDNTATFGGGGLNAPFESSSASAVTIVGSVVAGNKVSGGAANGQGGGLAVFGPLTVTNSTIAGNSVANPGANEGGGIVAARAFAETSTPQATLLNATVAGNSVSGPGGDFGGGLSGDNFGFMGPFASVLSAEDTIIASNSVDGATRDCDLVSTVSTDHNLSSDSSCGFSDAGSKQGTNPQLGPLQPNQGDTATEALLAPSPAINAGDNNGCPSTDQRGVSRPQAGVCDIGAYELVFEADLAAAITAAPNPAATGSNLTYTITVTNNGPQPAAGVIVTDPLPGGEKLVSASATCAGTPLACHLPDLAPGASESLTLVTTPQTPGTVTNTASVSGTYGDPNPANNSASVTTRVRRPTADVSITDAPRPAALTVGARTTFVLTVRNHGPDTASGVSVTDTPGSGLRIASIAGAVRCTHGPHIRCTLRSLASGKSRKLRVVAVPTASGRLANTAVVKARQVDPRRRNNRSVADVLVRATPAPRFTG